MKIRIGTSGDAAQLQVHEKHFLGINQEAVLLPLDQLQIDESLERLENDAANLSNVSTSIYEGYGAMAVGAWAIMTYIGKCTVERIAGQVLVHENERFLEFK